MAGPNRRAGARDMLLSLAVLLIPIVLIVWFFQTSPDEPNVNEAQWQPVVSDARKAAPYAVWAPSEVPATWKPIKAQWAAKGQTLPNGEVSANDRITLGFLNADKIYLSLDQTNGPADPLIKTVSRDGFKAGQTDLAGLTWTLWTSPDERTNTLSATTKDTSTLVVSGDTSVDQLTSFVQLLTTS